MTTTTTTTSEVCYNIADEARELVLTAIDRIVYDKQRGPYVICDYGAGDGLSTIPLMKAVVGAVNNKHGGDTEINVIYQDLPHNDFSQVFQSTRKHVISECASVELPRVFVLGCGGDFFTQCLAGHSVNLAVCFTCLHYLSTSPGTLDDSILHLLSRNKVQKQLFSHQAAEDWEHFLLSRAKELMTGGHLIVGSYVVDKEGQFTTKSNRVQKSSYEYLNGCWLRMYTDGHITKTEFNKATFDQYFRSESEYAQPMEDPMSPVYKAGLRLLSQQVKVIKDPSFEAFLPTDQSQDDAARFAKSLAEMRRSWNSHYFRKVLLDNRTDEDKNRILETFFGYYEAEILANPYDHAYDIVMSYLHFIKIA